MLTFGYMIEETTLIKEIKIRTEEQFYIKDKQINKKQYFFIDNENYLKDSEEEIMDNMHRLLEKSVDMF